MKRFQIYLPIKSYARLKDIAYKQNISIAELVRNILEKGLINYDQKSKQAENFVKLYNRQRLKAYLDEVLKKPNKLDLS